jgi:hypothetical protein
MTFPKFLDGPRKWRVLGVVLCIGVVGALGMVLFSQKPKSAPVSGGSGSGPDNGVLQLLAGRSPGERPEGALIRSKARQYALGKTRERPGAGSGPTGPRQYALARTRERVPTPQFSLGEPTQLTPQNVNFDPNRSLLGPNLSPLPGDVEPPSGPVLPAANAVPPTSAVPGPAAWAQMIGGVGLIGYALRAQRRKLKAAVSG